MKTIYLYVFAFLLLASGLSCHEQAVYAGDESQKSIAGKWKVVAATRNNADIYKVVDFSRFIINFNTDNTYNFENYLPFIVKKKGTWSLDDPQYPFKVKFAEDGSSESVTTDLTYPIVKGKRQILLSFSPGCMANKYQYVLERSN